MDPRARIEAYFAACSEGEAHEIASHFTDDAVVYDTNIRPMRGAAEIGKSWVKVRDRWDGARWIVDATIVEGDTAAIEWTMTGRDGDRSFTFRGSEHYRFAPDSRIAEIRQYWTFDPERLDTGLVGYDY